MGVSILPSFTHEEVARALLDLLGLELPAPPALEEGDPPGTMHYSDVLIVAVALSSPENRERVLRDRPDLAEDIETAARDIPGFVARLRRWGPESR